MSLSDPPPPFCPLPAEERGCSRAAADSMIKGFMPSPQSNHFCNHDSSFWLIKAPDSFRSSLLDLGSNNPNASDCGGISAHHLHPLPPNVQIQGVTEEQGGEDEEKGVKRGVCLAALTHFLELLTSSAATRSGWRAWGEASAGEHASSRKRGLNYSLEVLLAGPSHSRKFFQGIILPALQTPAGSWELWDRFSCLFPGRRTSNFLDPYN